jgi:hypothetical protein
VLVQALSSHERLCLIYAATDVSKHYAPPTRRILVNKDLLSIKFKGTPAREQNYTDANRVTLHGSGKLLPTVAGCRLIVEIG